MYGDDIPFGLQMDGVTAVRCGQGYAAIRHHLEHPRPPARRDRPRLLTAAARGRLPTRTRRRWRPRTESAGRYRVSSSLGLNAPKPSRLVHRHHARRHALQGFVELTETVGQPQVLRVVHRAADHYTPRRARPVAWAAARRRERPDTPWRQSFRRTSRCQGCQSARSDASRSRGSIFHSMRPYPPFSQTSTTSGIFSRRAVSISHEFIRKAPSPHSRPVAPAAHSVRRVTQIPWWTNRLI